MLTRLSVALVMGMVISGISTGALAQTATLEVPLNKSKLVPLRQDVSRVSVGEPAIADILITSPRQLYILGKSLGTTNVVLWDEDNNSFANFDVDAVD